MSGQALIFSTDKREKVEWVYLVAACHYRELSYAYSSGLIEGGEQRAADWFLKDSREERAFRERWTYNHRDMDGWGDKTEVRLVKSRNIPVGLHPDNVFNWRGAGIAVAILSAILIVIAIVYLSI